MCLTIGAIILFDGVCNLCQSSVQFIIKHDPKEYYRFASIQSHYGQRLIKERNISNHLNTLILVNDQDYAIKSAAALKICLHLNGAWKLLYLFIIVPRPIRDKVYDVIAKYRYRWFGRTATCLIPTDALKNRFLD